MKTSISALGLALLPAFAAAEEPRLTVYTYDSLIAEWGPGPALEAGFEAQCACDLRFVAAGDGAALLSRLLLEGAGSEADIVLGLDTALIARARASGLFAPHGVEAELALPVDWADPLFLPFDWGWFAFVGRSGIDRPDSLAALAESDLTVLIQDPRSSTPGLGLLMWVEATQPDPAAFWRALSDNIVTVTPGWSEAYGLFLSGEADLVLSYTTSPAYHLIAEGDPGFVALDFAEGHYLQIEVAAMLATSRNPELAQAFLRYLVSPEAQAVLPETNWMYPAISLPEGLPEGFDSLTLPARSLLLDPEEAEARRPAAIEAWRGALAR